MSHKLLTLDDSLDTPKAAQSFNKKHDDPQAAQSFNNKHVEPQAAQYLITNMMNQKLP